MKKKAALEAKLKEEAKKKEEEEAMKEKFEPITNETAKLIQQMHQLESKFEKSQSLDDYQKVKDLHNELRTTYHLNPVDIQTKFDVVPIFKSGFSEFPQIAANDFTQDQMQAIYVMQDNLNLNVENINLAQSFIKEVQGVSKRLEEEYKDYWQNPFKGQN